MPSAVSSNLRTGSNPPDELDRLLDYDNAVEDFMRDVPIGNDGQNNATTTEQPAVDDDQEVQVKRKRKPIPKLDENRLLSDQGIPRLRKITKTQPKFRGKGHEFADISRLLNTYQLWLDDLYPRAKFRDALAMVEKVGHSKRMQVMRKAWLDDTKPGRKEQSPDLEMSGALGDGDEETGATHGVQPSAEDLFQEMLRDEPVSGAATRESPGHDAPDDDELDALMAENGAAPVRNAQPPQTKRSGPFDQEDSDEDELDTRLAESNQNESSRHGRQAPAQENEPDEDELDALLAEETMAPQKQNNSSETDHRAQPSATQRHRDDDFAEEEEVMASMSGMW